MGFWLNLNAQVRPGHRRAAVGSQTPSRYRKFTNISRKYHFVGVPSPIQQSVKYGTNGAMNTGSSGSASTAPALQAEAAF